MEFESMTATTGVVSSYNNLYVVDNTKILIVNDYEDILEVPHEFDYITNITVSELYLFGIYKKKDKFGIFSMELTSHFFRMIPVEYTPVNLIYVNRYLIVIDTRFTVYEYENKLILRHTNTDLRVTSPVNFMTIGLAAEGDTLYWSKDKDVYTLKGKVLSVEGNILSLICYSKHLFVIYNSLYNHYSILQYDLENNKNVKVVDGGHISGPPIYSCIHYHEMYISASTNNKISMNMFNLPGKETNEKNRPRTAYPMFELSKSNPKFLDEEVKLDLEKIKTMREYDIKETDAAKDSLIHYYVWVCIFLFIVVVMILAFIFKENSVYPILLITILFIGLSFIIKNRYFI
jgi:hypothetical protein